MEKKAYAPVPVERLTESQKEAVFHREGPLLVLAGPGSGKTRVITSRIAKLIEGGVRPYNICAITFTNKAAEEMRQRVLEFGCSPGVHISTFHSLCVRILRMYSDEAKISSNFSIYDDADQKRCMKEAVVNCQFETSNFRPSRMLDFVSRFKNDLEGPEQVEARAYDFFTKNIAKIYRSYQRILASNNAVDFDDLLFRTAYLLRDCPQVRNQLSDRYRYLLVDEYQDTNHSQYEIAKGLALENRNICVTGDPDQSIYRWRGADIQNILRFEKDWPDAKVVKLEENFRSTGRILSAADKLIASNSNRKEKRLVSTRGDGDELAISVYPDEKSEALGAARKISALIESGADANEIAIFYRVNSMSRSVEEALINKNLPYQVVRGVEFYARKEIKDMLGYLKVIANPQDDVAFLRAVSTHSRGIGKTTVERISNYAGTHLKSIYEASMEAYKISSLSSAAARKVGAFAKMLKNFREEAQAGILVANLMERVFEESGYLDYLRAGGPKEQSAIENVEELINSAAKFDSLSEGTGLLDYLQAIALYSDADSFDPESGKVSLMTLHAAKGLEFEHVFIIGLEHGILPHERSMDNSEEMEEERRLFFVGITRAKDHLEVSYSRHRTVHGQFLRSMPSDFLFEIGYKEQDEFEQFSQVGQDIDDFGDFPESEQDVTADGNSGFAVNEFVRHKKFGPGRVKEFLDIGENSIVVVRFNSGKTKSLMVKYAKLERS